MSSNNIGRRGERVSHSAANSSPAVTSTSAMGITVGALIPLLENWKHSSQPDQYDGNHILFLRSNIESILDPVAYHNRTGNMAMNVDTNISILVPVFTAEYHIGSHYKGTKIESEIGARRAVREHIREGRGMWAVMRENKSKQPYQRIVDDLFSCYAESPQFKLTVSERNPFKDKLPEPIPAGSYDAVAGGYFILMNLPPGEHMIWFGANGPGMYHSEAYYQLNVSDKTRKPSLEDLSEDAAKGKLVRKVDIDSSTRSRF